MAVLRASNLAKSYKQKKVVLDVSLEIRSGEIVGLLGPNGAGKTTCFYMIVGLVPADHGRITIDTQDITPLPCTTFDGTTESGAVSTTRPFLPASKSRRDTTRLFSCGQRLACKSQANANRCWVRTGHGEQD